MVGSSKGKTTCGYFYSGFSYFQDMMFLSTNLNYHIKAMHSKVASLFQALLSLLLLLLSLLLFIKSSLRQRVAHFKS